MSDSPITSFLVSDVSESLRLLNKNERCERIAQVAHQKWAMWANRSGRSLKMSDYERFAQVAHQKWVNEWLARFFEQIAHLLIFSQKTSHSLRKLMSKLPQPCFYLLSLAPQNWKSCFFRNLDTGTGMFFGPNKNSCYFEKQGSDNLMPARIRMFIFLQSSSMLAGLPEPAAQRRAARLSGGSQCCPGAVSTDWLFTVNNRILRLLAKICMSSFSDWLFVG